MPSRVNHTWHMTEQPQPITQIVLVAPDPAQRAWLSELLERAGHAVVQAEGVAQAQALAHTRPGARLLCAGLSLDDLILTQRPHQPGGWGADHAAALRTDTAGAEAPTLVLNDTDLATAETVLSAVRRWLGNGPPAETGTGPRPALLSEAEFAGALARELERLDPAGRPLWLIYLHSAELSALYFRHGPQVEGAVAGQILDLIGQAARPNDLTARDGQGRFALLWPDLSPGAADQRLQALNTRLLGHDFQVDGDLVRVRPVLGYTRGAAGAAADELRARALHALSQAEARPDRSPVLYAPAAPVRPVARRAPRPARSPLSRALAGVALLAGVGGLAALALSNLSTAPAPLSASAPPVQPPPVVVVPPVPEAPSPAAEAPPPEPPAPTPAPLTPPIAAPPPAAPKPADLALDRGRQVASAFYGGRLDRVWAALRPSVRSEWGDFAAFQAYRAQGKTAYGAETRVVQEQVTRSGQVTYYTRTATFERGPRRGWTLIIGLDASGQVREFGIVGADALPDLRAGTVRE